MKELTEKTIFKLKPQGREKNWGKYLGENQYKVLIYILYVDFGDS